MPTVAYHEYRQDRQKLLISCATIAIALAATAPQKARAQAFQGSPTTAAGTVDYARATPGSETITIGSSTATINWVPSDVEGVGNINFLPVGNTATYQGTTGLSDFTVLNRIVPTNTSRTIELNGTVLSKLSGGAIGGNVWFYSPGGIVIGAQAVFDVGGLLLSSIDLPNGFSTTASSFTASFTKTANNAGNVRILAGAQINARDSYVALVAPRIEQGGNVQVNGSAAYAAAEQLTMTFNQGLFDVAVPLGGGTTDANGIVHTGITGGPANVTPTDNHTIYMVAVPKNQALTMLLGGSVGFAPAAAGATVENGQIFLRSGFAGGGASGGGTGSLAIGSQGAATFTSDVLGQLDGAALIQATSGDVAFDRDLSLTNASGINGGITLSTNNQRRLTVGGDAVLDAAGNIALNALSGSLTVAGTINAVTDGTITLADGNGAGSIGATTMMLFASGITRQADPDVTNLIASLTGDFAAGDISVPGFLSLSADGDLTAGNVSAGTALTLLATGDLTVRDASAATAIFSADGTANFLGTVRAPS
ncbi:MAG TPA: hypothetical protein VJT70_10430, partial [Sphingomicrobium sp.]|nr:hypothetical protein [Sphingomicrobium sp.]